MDKVMEFMFLLVNITEISLWYLAKE